MLNENLVNLFERSFRANWQLPAFSDFGGEPLTFQQAAEKIMRLHNIFKKNHIKKGDKIALVGRNSTGWAITYIATVTYGAVIVPILPDFHTDDIHYIINHSDSVFLFASESIYEMLDDSKLQNIDAVFSISSFRLLQARKKSIGQQIEKAESSFQIDLQKLQNEFSFEPFQNQDIAALVYTSGTTSFSKGVILNHNTLTANIVFAMNNMPLKSGDKVVSFLPLAHAYGCAFEFLFPFCVGCHITFLSKIPSPTVIIQAFQEVKPRIGFAVPLIMEKIYRKQIRPVLFKKHIRFLCKIPLVRRYIYGKIKTKLIGVFGGNFFEIVIGGAPLNAEVESFLRAINFPFTVGYGMTECGPLISYSPWDKIRFQSVGKVIDTLQIKIDSPDPAQIVGEICVRGENIMDGYYKNEEATRNTIDPEGWLHTGDLGLIDENGFIFIKGRSKSMILGASGQNIYPEEIEAKLNNLPFVQESVVMEKNGKIIALVYPDIEAIDAKSLSEKELAVEMEKNRIQINQKLPSYCSISSIELYPNEFEKTPSKKIKRFLYTILADKK